MGAAASRATGVLDASGRYGVSDHAACAYRSLEERAALASAWLRDGLRRGQRALYIADGERDALSAEVTGDDELAAAVDRGALVVATATELYDLSRPIDAAEQLAAYDHAVDAAIADGYEGLRVAADITVLVADPARRESHLRWEQIADRYITGRPLAPACLYDARTVTDVDAIVCAHPLRDPDHTDFAVYGRDAAASAIAGDVDRFGGGCFGELLAAIPVGDRTLDLTALSFLDVNSAWVLQDELRRRREAGATLAVVGAQPIIRRVWDLCGFDPSLLGAVHDGS